MTQLPKQFYFLFAKGLAALALLITAGWLFFYFHQPVKLMYHLADLKVDSPITIRFTQPVQDHVNYSISPSLDGSWKVSKNVLGVTSINFYPAHPLTPGSNYQMVVGHVAPLIATAPTIQAQTLPVTVEKPAAVSAISPANTATNVPVDTAIAIKLGSPNHGLRKLNLQSDAALASPDPTSTDDTTFVWHLAKPLPQGTTYHVTLTDTNQTASAKRLLLAATFTTVPEPHITSATNRDHFYPGDTVTITFDQDMKPLESTLKFPFAGSGHWQDPRTYIFTPTGLSPGQSYNYTVQQHTTSTTGGVTEADHAFTISPPGAVYVTGSGPGGSSVATNASLSFTFDQPVDHASAQAAFSISPATNGSFSWSGNTMTFHPDGLGYQTGYTAAVAPGVKGTYGLPSTRNFTDSFSTTYQIIKLGVPSYHQAYSLSCEAASLRMALAFRGISTSDYDINMHLGYSPRPRDTTSNSWDNPYQMFVGDMNGQDGVTGWGVYGPPIAAAAQAYGRNASYVSGISANQIAQAIHDNNPVVLWGFSGPSLKPDSWNTPSGVVQTPRNEHARTVYGVAGSAANPIGFYLHDPYYGDIYWTTAQLQYNMSFASTLPSQAVIVY